MLFAEAADGRIADRALADRALAERANAWLPANLRPSGDDAKDVRPAIA